MAKMEPENELNKLRAQIRQVDEELLSLVARRQKLAEQVGQAKLAHGLPIKDYRVEKEVVEVSRRRARELGIYEEAAEEITKALIKYSCQVQEEYQGHAKARTQRSRRQIVIAGGLGQMGKWLGRFFEAFGHSVSLFDSQTAAAPPFPVVDSLERALKSADVFVLATPISHTAAVLEATIPLKPKALIFDICSLKSPILPSIKKAQAAGLRVSSVHPMFGPSAQWLAGRNILLCDSGNETLLEETAGLFRESTANLVRVPLDRHDEFMGYVLGLSHLTNLVFGATLEKSGINFSELRGIGSTTFHAQTAVSEAVVKENQELYYEIQAENGFTPQVMKGMKAALGEYVTAIESSDRAGFKALMEKSRAYFAKP